MPLSLGGRGPSGGRNRRDYAAGAQYSAGDIVFSGGIAYYANVDIPSAPATIDLTQFTAFPGGSSSATSAVIWLAISFPGDLSQITTPIPIPIPRATATIGITHAKAAVGTPSAGQAIIFDVLRRNTSTGATTSIFTDPATRPRMNPTVIQSTVTIPGVTTLSAAQDALVAVVAQVGTTVPGSDACLTLRLTETG